MATIKKPLGITATAVYAAFSGLLYLPIGLILLIAAQANDSKGLFIAGGLLLSALGIFMLASVYGLWSLQEWGRKLTLWLSAISIVLGVVAIFPIWPKQQFTMANTILQFFGIGICVLIITYLSKTPIKGLFENEQP